MDELRLFAILDKNNLVLNVIASPKYIMDYDYDEMVLYEPTHVISEYSEGERLQEYSQDDDSITKNPGAIGYTYDSTLNAFIPPAPDPTYILDEYLLEWYPNPDIEYTIDGKVCKWKPNFGWKLVRK
jgi:hypothetical protein